MKTRFETEVCSRCDGSGQYSYCQEFGTNCFKCSGAGRVLSKRGSVAKTYLEKLCTKPVSEVKVGDKIVASGITNNGRLYRYIATVTEIKPGRSATVTIDSETKTVDYVDLTLESEKYGKSGLSTPVDSTVRFYGPDNNARIHEALVYQSTLTKTGTVRKSLKKDSSNE